MCICSWIGAHCQIWTSLEWIWSWVNHICKDVRVIGMVKYMSLATLQNFDEKYFYSLNDKDGWGNNEQN